VVYNDGFVYRLSYVIVTLMWIATFGPLTAGLRQAIMSTGHVSLYVAPWVFVIGAFRSSLWSFSVMIAGF